MTLAQRFQESCSQLRHMGSSLIWGPFYFFFFFFWGGGGGKGVVFFWGRRKRDPKLENYRYAIHQENELSFL